VELYGSECRGFGTSDGNVVARVGIKAVKHERNGPGRKLESSHGRKFAYSSFPQLNSTIIALHHKVSEPVTRGVAV
jgi:hypothetical protein